MCLISDSFHTLLKTELFNGADIDGVIRSLFSFHRIFGQYAFLRLMEAQKKEMACKWISLEKIKQLHPPWIIKLTIRYLMKTAEDPQMCDTLFMVDIWRIEREKKKIRSLY